VIGQRFGDDKVNLCEARVELQQTTMGTKLSDSLLETWSRQGTTHMVRSSFAGGSALSLSCTAALRLRVTGRVGVHEAVGPDKQRSQGSRHAIPFSPQLAPGRARGVASRRLPSGEDQSALIRDMSTLAVKAQLICPLPSSLFPLPSSLFPSPLVPHSASRNHTSPLPT
jgi:hypothetical protein